MTHKDRKTRKLRGSRTHGYGNTQKHRGAGNRGGRGMAGSKKQKWHHVSKNMPGYFGRKGFKRHSPPVSEKTVNVGYLSQNIQNFIARGMVTESGGIYSIDLKSGGYTKLLGAGKTTHKLKVIVDKCTVSAKEKIEASGGSVETTQETDEVGA